MNDDGLEEISDTLELGWYYSENKGEFQMVKIAEKDRAIHLYVIGASGMGKTKFLEFLIQQDIEKGNGFGVIDPHGDLIEDIKGFLSYYPKQELSERVVLIDPSDPEYTITFNPIEKIPNISIPEQASELVGAFKKIWSDSWGVRMEDLMRNSLIALGEAGLTLADLPQFYTSRPLREIVLKKITHPITIEYFKRFNSLTTKERLTWIEPVMNKVNAFLSDDRIRQIFSYPKSSFNIREIMDNQKILLIKLDKGKLKDASELLGSLLMAKITMSAFSRSDIPLNKRIPFYLYIDEFQNFASESFEVVLSEARKYGLSLIMSHQTLSQISKELRSLILGNTGIQVYFRVNREDAELLAKEGFEYSGYEVKIINSLNPVFWGYTEEWEHKIRELQTLPPKFCYVKHKIEGGIIPIQTAQIEPPEIELSEIKSLPIGRNYLIPRKDLVASMESRQKLIKKEIEAEVEKWKQKQAFKDREYSAKTRPAEPYKSPPEFPTNPPAAEKSKERVNITLPQIDMPILEGIGGQQHRYLQSLIKRIAEEKGFKAIIEKKTPDDLGIVDVDLEIDGKKIACEISITSTGAQEIENIKKCIKAGYDKIILCSPEKKTLEKVKTLISQGVNDFEQDKIIFLQPEELVFFLEKEAANSISKEERVKGYKVKVQYQPVPETEKKTKREAVGQVILQALRRLKGKN